MIMMIIVAISTGGPESSLSAEGGGVYSKDGNMCSVTVYCHAYIIIHIHGTKV